MRGLPKYLKTQRDWENAVAYSKGKSELSRQMIRRLAELKNTQTMLVPKADAPSDPEERTREHYEEVFDPASAFAQTGFSESDIDELIKSLGG